MINNNGSEEVKSTSFTSIEVLQGFQDEDKAVLLGVLPAYFELERIHDVCDEQIKHHPKFFIDGGGIIYMVNDK